MKFKTPPFVLISLICLSAYVMGMSLYWASVETRPPHWDMGYHLWCSLTYFDYLKDLRHIYRLWTSYHYYPPFRYWTTIPFYAVFGISFLTAISSNLVFILLLAFSAYGIGKTLWNDRVGILTSLFVLTSPVVASQFKEYQADDPLAAMVAFGFYLLLKSDRFRNRKVSLWLGVVFGLGMLTKWTFLFFFFLPLGSVVLDIWNSKDRTAFRNLWQSALIGILIASLWYGAYPRDIFQDLFLAARLGRPEWAPKSPPVLTWDAAIKYPEYLLNYQLYLVPFLFLAVGLIFSCLNRDFRLRNKFPLLMMVGTYICFCCIRNKDVRYTIPMLAAAGVVSVSWLELLGSKRLRSALVILFTAYGLSAYWIMSLGTSVIPYSLEVPVSKGGSIVVFRQGGYGIGAPTHEQWHQEEIFRIISSDPGTGKVLAFKGLDTIWFNWAGNQYFGLRYGVTMDNGAERPDYFLLRGLQKTTQLKGYESEKEYQLPDGSWLDLFRARPTSMGR